MISTRKQKRLSEQTKELALEIGEQQSIKSLF